jgi:hypothetical protein
MAMLLPPPDNTKPVSNPPSVADPSGQASLTTSISGNLLLIDPTSATILSTYRSVEFRQAGTGPMPQDPETQEVLADPALYGALVTRLNYPGRLVPAEEVLGDLDVTE